MSEYVVKPLDGSTWDAFARLVERHNGVFGGCWCTWFHTFHAEKTFTADGNRALKERLVAKGRGKKVSVLYNSTRSLYEREGFSYLRSKGTRNCVMRKTVRSRRRQ